ncbi:MAG: trigger factor [Angelakisella sp.]
MKLLANKKIDTNLYELEIRVDGEEYKAALEKSFANNSKKLNVPGFRKGKAPKAMIMKLVGEEYFYDDAINSTYQAAYSTALDESGLQPVDRADVEMGEVTGEGYTFTAKVTVRPEVTVKDYKGLSAAKTAVTVTDEEITAELDKMADRNSRLIDIDDRAARDGDTVNINFEGFVDEVAFQGGKGENYDLVLGSHQFIPGFEEQVVDKKIDEEFDVNVSFPEDYQAEELKGKAAVFKVKLNSIKFKETPAIDDEFAKDVSEFDTLALLRADMLEKMTEQKQKHADEAFENELCEAAAANMEAVIPQAMIDRKIDEMVQDFGYRLQSQGMKLEDYLKYTGGDMDAFRKNFAPQAEQQVKVTLTLEKIAELEGLTPTAEAITAEYEKAAKSYNIELEKVKTFISEESIASSLKLNMAVDLIKENAVVTAEAKAKPASKKAEKSEKEEKPAAEKPKKAAAPKAKKVKSEKDE